MGPDHVRVARVHGVHVLVVRRPLHVDRVDVLLDHRHDRVAHVPHLALRLEDRAAAVAEPRAGPEQLIDSVGAAILEVQEGRWQFAHDKLREGILAGLDAAEHQTLHRRVARVMERVYPDDPDHYLSLAWHWDHAGAVEKGARYAGLAGELSVEASAYEEAVGLIAQALYPLEGDTSPHGKARAAHLRRLLASAQWGLSHYEVAQQLYEESLLLYRELDNAAGMAEALKGLGDVARRRGDFDAARQYFSECLVLCQRSGDPLATGQALARLGLVARVKGEYAHAEDYYHESLAMFEAVDEPVRMASLQSGLALIASDQGRLDEAREYILKSLATARQVHNPSGTALILTGLAWIEYLSGDYEQAYQHSQESLTLSHDIGDRWSAANNLGNLGKIACAIDDFATAGAHFRDALTISQAIGSTPLTLEILPGVAALYHKQGLPQQAALLLTFALQHPACYSEVEAQALPLLDVLRAELSEAQLADIQRAAEQHTLETLLAQLIFEH